MDISRRQFIRGAGAAIAVAAAPVILMPEKRIWQVHRDTPLHGSKRIHNAGTYKITLDKGPWGDNVQVYAPPDFAAELSSGKTVAMRYDKETGEWTVGTIEVPTEEEAEELRAALKNTPYTGRVFSTRAGAEAAYREQQRESEHELWSGVSAGRRG